MKMPFLSTCNYFARQDYFKQNNYLRKKKEKISLLPQHLIVILGSGMSFQMDFSEGNWLFIGILCKKRPEQLSELKRNSLIFFSPFLLPGQAAALGLCSAWTSLQTSSAIALVAGDADESCHRSPRQGPSPRGLSPPASKARMGLSWEVAKPSAG